MDRSAKTSTPKIEQEERYLVALIKDKKVAFSVLWVQEILLFRRSQMLELPFYDSAFLGVIHHQNQIVPLVAGRKIFLNEATKISQTTLTAVRLNQLGQDLTGVGIVVDLMVENMAAKELTQEHLFQLTDIPQHLWQPQR